MKGKGENDYNVKPMATCILIFLKYCSNLKLLVINVLLHDKCSTNILMRSCSTKVVLSSLLLEKIELLERLQSVDSKDQVAVLGNSESGHSILKLDIVEDNLGNVVGVLLGQGFVGSTLNSVDKSVGISEDGCGNLGACVSSGLVSGSLGI